eukprot:1158198-Pelagomonas_calceolata.AAC.6
MHAVPLHAVRVRAGVLLLQLQRPAAGEALQLSAVNVLAVHLHAVRVSGGGLTRFQHPAAGEALQLGPQGAELLPLQLRCRELLLLQQHVAWGAHIRGQAGAGHGAAAVAAPPVTAPAAAAAAAPAVHIMVLVIILITTAAVTVDPAADLLHQGHRVAPNRVAGAAAAGIGVFLVDVVEAHALQHLRACPCTRVCVCVCMCVCARACVCSCARTCTRTNVLLLNAHE